MRLRKALNILEIDLRPLLLLGALHFVVAGAHALFDIATTSLVVARLGPGVLPQVYVGSALLLILAGLFLMPVIDRLNRLKLFAATLAAFAALLVVSHPIAPRAPEIVYRALYLACYLMKSLVFLQFWLIAGEICDVRQAKRVFPPLLGFSLAGGLVASLAASWGTSWLATEDFLLLAAALLAAALGITHGVNRRFKRRFRSVTWRAPWNAGETWDRLRGDLKTSLGSPLLRNLSLTFVLLALLAQVLDFLMGTAASLHFVHRSGALDHQALTSFYAVLNASVIGAAALVQFLVSRRILSSVGVTRGQLAVPFSFLVGFGAVGATLVLSSSVTAFFAAVLASRAIQKVLRVSLHRSSTDLIYNPVPGERRGRVKAFKETIIEPTGVLLGGLFLLAGTAFPLRWLVVASLVLASFFLYLSLRLKSHYLQSLVDVLREKSRFRFAFSSAVMRRVEPEASRKGKVSELEDALEDAEASVRLLAVELAAELREPAAAPVLVKRFRQESDPRVRATMVSALGKLLRRDADSLRAVEPALEDDDPRVRANAIEAMAQIGVTDSSSYLRSFTEAPEPRVRANAAWALNRLDPEAGAEKARAVLYGMFVSRDESTRLSAVYGLGEIADDASMELLDRALADDRMAVRRRAILSLARAGRRDSLDRLVRLLEDGDGATRHLAARALETCGEAAVDPLLLTLWSSSVEVRRYVLQALAHIESARAQQAVIHILSLEAEEAYYTLSRLERLERLPEAHGLPLVREDLARRADQSRRNAIQVLYTVYGDRVGMRIILSNLSHPDAYVRTSAIEALETRVHGSRLGGILPLFEHAARSTVIEHGASYYQLPAKPPLDVLVDLTTDRSRWTRACALYVLGQIGGSEAHSALERGARDSYELARLNAVEGLGRIGTSRSLPLLEQLAQEGQGTLARYATDAAQAIRRRAAPTSP